MNRILIATFTAAMLSACASMPAAGPAKMVDGMLAKLGQHSMFAQRMIQPFLIIFTNLLLKPLLTNRKKQCAMVKTRISLVFSTAI